MSQAEIIRIEYEALMKFCKGDRALALKTIQELGLVMRNYFEERHPQKVTTDDLCSFLETITQDTAKR